MHVPATDPRKGGVREVLTLAWPIMLGMISFSVMDFVDRLFVARIDAEGANLAAVGSASIWAYTIGMFFLGVAGCVATFVSQSLGRGQKENCAAYAWQGLYFSLGAGSVALLIWPLADELFVSMGHSARVTELEIVYFRIRILGFAFVAAQAALASFFQSINRPRIPMYVSIAANLSNIGLDYVLIFGKLGLPPMGIAGAATATVISMFFQVALLLAVFLHRNTNTEFASRSSFALDRTKMRELVRIGWPSGVAALLDVASWAVFSSYIVGRFGTAQLAAHNAALAFIHLSFIPVLALEYAATPIVANWIGRGRLDVAKARAYTATKIGIVQMVTVGTTFAVFSGPFMKVFSDNPIVIDIGQTLLVLAAIFAGFDAVTIVLYGALRGAGDTRWMMTCMFVGSYGVSLPLAWLFAGPLGLEAKGAWIGATIYIILLSGAFFWRFRSEAWRHIRIFDADRPPPRPAEVPEEGSTTLS